MWKWVERARQFISKQLGRLTRPAQEKLSQVNVQDHAARIKRTTSQWGEGKLSVPIWYKATRKDLKNLYIQNYVLGRGGKAQLTQVDYGSIGGMLKEQYRYLDGFAKELAAGTVTPAQAAMRAEMYARSAREAHERGKSRAWSDATEVLWVVSHGAENCEDCLALEALDWQKREDLDTVPGAGDTRCLTNCMCSLIYR